MAYTTVAKIKDYSKIKGDGDDALLQDILTRAESIIEAHTNRVFQVSSNTSHYLQREWLDRDDPYLLHMDDELISVATLTNGDSDSTSIPSTEYWLTDSVGNRNYGPPYQAIKLKSDSDYSWEWDTDYHVEISGHWGYSDDPPADIVHATIRLVTWMWRQRLEGSEDTITISPEGMVMYPQHFPKDVKSILDNHSKAYSGVGVG